MVKIKSSTNKHTQKEALFNEVKGSLFEYLVAKEISKSIGDELGFQNLIDPNYLNVLGQQDRMVRQFYPEMASFLFDAAKKTGNQLMAFFKDKPISSKVVGKFSNSSLKDELHEADIIIEFKSHFVPLSLKLNKKNSYVNTKSGGIKSFFETYFPFIHQDEQRGFNIFVDTEFNRMAFELHALHDMEYSGSFNQWVSRGYSELPGELDQSSRNILKSYYSRIAQRMHDILASAFLSSFEGIKKALPPLMGFSSKDILQVIYFHDFPSSNGQQIETHSYENILNELSDFRLLPFNDTSSVEFQMGNCSLQIRVKPMNKFTTTAIKINCSVKFKQPSIF